MRDPIPLGVVAASSTLLAPRKCNDMAMELGYSTFVQVRPSAADVLGTGPALAWKREDQKCLHRHLAARQVEITPETPRNESEEELDRLDVQSDAPAYVPLLQQCVTAKSLSEGRRIHAAIKDRGQEGDVSLQDLLLQMYSSCGALEEAREVFANMSQRTLSSWASIIGAYAQNGQIKEALEQLQEMRLKGLTPYKRTFVSLLSACTSQGALAEGRRIHRCIESYGFESDVIVGTALVNMYGKCNSLEEARTTFERMPERNVVSWTTMIAACSQHGQGMEALQLFQQMLLEGVMPNKFTFVGILTVYVSKEDLGEGKRMHVRIAGCGFESDVIVGTSLLTMYGKCNCLDFGRQIFDKMPERNLVSWTAMISAYVEHGHGDKALHLYEHLLIEGIKPNKITFVSLLYACSNQGALAKGKQIHAHIVCSGFESHVVMGNALIYMYGKCGSLENAQKMLDKMLVRDVVSWTSMISAFANAGQGKEALKLFQQMEIEGVLPNKITFVSMLSACASLVVLNEGKQLHARAVGCGFELDSVLGTALIHMYGTCGSPKDAKRVFDRMLERDVVTWNAMMAECGSLEDAQTIFDEMPQCDEASWNTIIATHIHHGHSKSSLELYHKMQAHGLSPNEVTFVSVLEACASHAALVEGKRIHAKILTSGFEVDNIVGNALIHMYGRCGSLEDACRVFEEMQDLDVISWTTIIGAYAHYGHGKEAFRLFQKMIVKGVTPNDVTLVSILCACSHSGLENEGLETFLSMIQVYGIAPTVDHYNCVIDLLGRAGRLDEGEDLINSIPCQPTSTLWMTLLNACRMHCDAERGQRVAEKIYGLEPENATAYVVLSNIHAAAGRWDDAAKVRKLLTEKGLRKPPGRSSIEIGCRVHEFFANDQQHPQKERIYAELERLATQIKGGGYVPDTKSVLHDVEEDVKEYMLSVHSEKLAIAFGLISTPDGTLLRITKNLRVCNDCHLAIKFISKLERREILLRDAGRFHLFKDGVCSCADYW